MKNESNKVINAWCMYDWANSAYSLVITSTIFPVYYATVTRGAYGNDMVDFFGIPLTNTVLYSWSISLSFLLVAILSPLLSGIADYSGQKKTFMRFFTYMGSIACCGLYFFEGENIEYGIICSILASIGYSGSLVFYNAFLPEITSPDRYDVVSAKGYSYGYIGSVILLVISLAMVISPASFGIPTEGIATKISFLMVGFWWFAFAQVTFYFLPNNGFNKQPHGSILRKGYLEIRYVWQKVQKLHMLKRFLISFFFYSVGVQTVMYLAATFGDKELRLPADKLILTILIIQLVAIGGSYLFAWISGKKGNKFSLMMMVLIWVFICFYAYFVTTASQFYILAFIVGLVMGGIQSLSRSTYSKLIPEDTTDHASYFSFFDVVDKMAIVLGTFSYGLIEQMTGSMRNSTVALALFFLVGFYFLLRVTIPLKKGIKMVKI